MPCVSVERYKPAVFAALALAALASAQAQDLPEITQRQIGALLSEKAARNPAQAKMDSHLVHAAQVLRGQPMSPDLPSLQGELEAVRPDANNFVEVDIRADVGPDLLALIRSLGGTVVNAFPEYQSVRARLPLLSVERVAQRGDVRQIRMAGGYHVNAAPAGSLGARAGFAARGRAVRAQLAAFFASRKGASLPAPALGSLLRSLGAAFSGAPPEGPDSYGDVAHQANTARSTFNLDGTGVKIGVISDGVTSLAGEQTKGNLPSNVTVISGQAGPPPADEGTAMLEIVYTLAPGATLYFATGDPSAAQMASNIHALASAGCNVIVDDITYFSEGPFQDDVVAQAVNAVTAAGVFYFSSAGNDGNLQAGTSGTWQGDFVDSKTTLATITAAETGTYTLHSFGAASYDTLTQPSSVNASSGTGVYELMWSDPLNQSNNDYDLFITDSSGNVLGSSTNVQNGAQDPDEEITGSTAIANACAPAKGAASGTCRIFVVKHASALARTLYLSTGAQDNPAIPGAGNLQISTGSATYGHNAAASAFGVAATDARYAIPQYFSQCSGFSPTCNNGVETFSSDGPRQIFYNPDGTAITPGSVTIGASGGKVLNKPDITAADAVNTGVAGFTLFGGTSAAAPHAAAIAGLLLEAVPTLTPATMRAALVASAIDIHGLPNINVGAGVIMAPAATQSACGYSVGSVSSVPGSGGSIGLSIQAGPNCPWTLGGLPAWISGATSGKGTVSVPLTVAANSGAPRSATVSLTAGTLSLASASITQAGPPPLVITTSATLLSGFTTGAYTQDLAATGGVGAYTWTRTAGSLPGGLAISGAAIMGTPTAAGTFTFTLQVADSATPTPSTASQAFSLTVVNVSGSSALSRVGVLPQFAAGGSFDTAIWVVNTSAAAVPVRLVFHGDDGTLGFKSNDSNKTPTPTPLTVSQQGDTQSGITATAPLDRVLDGNSVLVVDGGLGQAVNVQGWVDVLTAAAGVGGFAVFRYAPNGLTPTGAGYFTPWEGTVPLQTQLTPSTLTLPFDNTNGFSNGVAIGTLAGAGPITITATFYDINGNQTLGAPQTLAPALAVNGHTSFLLNSEFSNTANKQGTVVFTGTTMMGLGLRASPYGTLTSVPVILQ
jgi:hypothetical protein